MLGRFLPMRWLARRLVFYFFALWVAVTLNFMLPRLMPGDPLGGVLAASDPGADPVESRDHPDLSGDPRRRPGRSGGVRRYLHHVATLDFGLSTSNYPSSVSEVVGRTLPYSIFLVGVAFALAFILGTTIGMIAAWRRGGASTTWSSRAHVAQRVPGLLHRARRRLLPRLKAGLVPDPARVRQRHRARASTGRSCPARRHAQLPILVIMFVFAGGWVLNMRTVMINTIAEDYVGDGAGQGPARPPRDDPLRRRNAILPPLNGFAAQFATAVGGLVFIEFVFSYPGAGLTLQQAALGADYPLTQALLLVLSVCVIAANFIMDILNFFLDPRVRT